MLPYDSTRPQWVEWTWRWKLWQDIYNGGIMMPYLTYLVTHCGLVTPYGSRYLGQHWFRQWLVAWRHQAITWTNVDLSSLKSSDVHLRAISLEISHPLVTKISLNIIFLRSYWNLPGANELSHQHHNIISHSCTREYIYLFRTSLGFKNKHLAGGSWPSHWLSAKQSSQQILKINKIILK